MLTSDRPPAVAPTAMGMHVSFDAPYLTATFGQPQRMLSWAIVGGGLRTCEQVVFRQVCNADLPVGLDAASWFAGQLQRDLGDRPRVGLLTSRRLEHFEDERKVGPQGAARCLATVGLSNALRAGDPVSPAPVAGTINVMCAVDRPLQDAALSEMLAIVTEAKTLAIVEAGVPSRVSGATASGTGTDCTVVVAPVAAKGQSTAQYAGKHTGLGHLVGAAVYGAVRRGAETWKRHAAEGALWPS